MAPIKKILLNAVQVGTSIHHPGEVFDSIRDADRIVLVQNCGGKLVTSTPTLLQVAAGCRVLHSRGVADEILAEFMLAWNVSTLEWIPAKPNDGTYQLVVSGGGGTALWQINTIPKAPTSNGNYYLKVLDGEVSWHSTT